MEIRISKGCYSSSLTIDDIPIKQVNQEERLEIVRKLITIVDTDQLESIIQEICELLGEYIPDESSCEQCGELSHDYILNID